MTERQQTDDSESWWRRGMAVFRGNRRHERAAHALYGAIVAAAREPTFYDRLGVPDTMDGRFEMIGLHAALVMRRLRTAGPEGQALAQALFDLMFADLDRNLREAGVGDLSVGRHVKGLASTFLARAQSLDQPLDSADRGAIAAIVVKNLQTSSTGMPAGDGRGIADRLIAADALLAGQSSAEIVAGRVRLKPDGESR